MKSNQYHWQNLRNLRNEFNELAMDSMEPLSKKNACYHARILARQLGCIFHLSEIESMRVIASHDMINSYVANEYESGKNFKDAKLGASYFEAMRKEINKA